MTDKKLPVIATTDPVADLPAITAFPASEKVHVEGGGLSVPMRRITLSNGEHFDVYDTSGPQGCDPHKGQIGRAHV